MGIDIAYYVRVDFEGFKAIVDTLGGVVLDVERRMYYEDNAQGLKIDLQKGLQRLNGEQALQYVRYRSDGMGDVSLVDANRQEYAGRVQRQLKFVRAMFQQALSPRNVLNAAELIRQMQKAVRTNMPIDVALVLAAQFRDVGIQELETAILPGAGGVVGGASYWVVNEAKAQEVVNRLILRRRDMVRVEVLNGNGINGTASRVADYLRNQGFEVVAVGNADRFDYPATTVIPRRGRTASAERVATVLGGRVQNGGLRMPGTRSADADVIVIVGRDYSI